jgi:hypothetical protein
VSGYHIVTATSSGQSKNATANCLAGESALGGGGSNATGSLVSSVPVVSGGNATGWTVTGTTSGVTTYVICAKVS